MKELVIAEIIKLINLPDVQVGHESQLGQAPN